MSYTYQCTKSEYVRTDSEGKPWYRAVIVTNDTDPDIESIDPATVKGLADDCGLAAGSVVLYPDGQYLIAYADVNGGDDPGEDEVMTVNLTFDEANHTLTMDKHASEIYTALEGGKIVRTLVDMGDETMPLYYWGYVGFTAPATEGYPAEEIQVMMIDLDGADAVKWYSFVCDATDPTAYPVCTLPAGE